MAKPGFAMYTDGLCGPLADLHQLIASPGDYGPSPHHLPRQDAERQAFTWLPRPPTGHYADYLVGKVSVMSRVIVNEDMISTSLANPYP